MALKMKNPNRLVASFAMFMVFFFLVIFINYCLIKQVDTLTKKSNEAASLKEKASVLLVAEEQAAKKKILRVERKDPKTDVIESVILAGKEETARFKIKNGKIIDLTGAIPEGEIKFVNKWNNTYGFEYYKDGKRDGTFLEYYGNGNIKERSEYSRGRLLTRLTYFLDGSLRMEEDLTEARFMTMRLVLDEEKYVGKGKIYRSSGSLKFEWQFIDGSDENYTRAYNAQGSMIEENYFDAQGDPVIRQATVGIITPPVAGSTEIESETELGSSASLPVEEK